MADEIDLRIENLSDVEVIGRGGFSTVYGASHTLLKRRVAVKVLNRLTRESERRRFERECEVLGRLSDHPNVVSVHQAGYTADGSPYLIMELVDGGTLADLLERRGRMPWEEALDYLVPVCEALGRAHDESILHRDVKPENILLARGEPRLADFGIAYLRDATGATSTHITASWLHTPPETFDNRRDERSDLYSVASTLYTLIAGHAPFWRPDEESLNPLMARLLNEPAPDLPDGLAPVALNDFILRTLAKDPDERPQTASAFTAELLQIRAVAAEPAEPVGSAAAVDRDEGAGGPSDAAEATVVAASAVDPDRLTEVAPISPPASPPAPVDPTPPPPVTPPSRPTAPDPGSGVPPPPAFQIESPPPPPPPAAPVEPPPPPAARVDVASSAAPGVDTAARTEYVPPQSLTPSYPPPAGPPVSEAPAQAVPGVVERPATAAPRRAGAGWRLLVLVGALLGIGGLVAESIETEIYDSTPAEFLVINTGSIGALGLLVLAVLPPLRRRSLGGLSFAFGGGVLAFDVGLRLLFAGDLWYEVQVARVVAGLGCGLLLLVGVVLLQRASTIRVGRVIVLLIVLVALLVGAALIFSNQFRSDHQAERTAAYIAGALGLTIGSMLVAGGSLPLASASYGFVITGGHAAVWYSHGTDEIEGAGVGLLTVGFLLLGFHGLTRLGRDQRAAPGPNVR